jgi:HD-like signal output (HDOD) protein
MDAPAFVKNIKNLPTPSPVLKKICEVADNPESTPEQVVEALKLDPAIAGKILRLANTAHTGIPRRISSLRNAVALLGVSRVRSLVQVTRHVSPAMEKTAPFTLFSLERFWRHATAAALIAESIARHCQRYGAIDEQEAFSAGLLHDIGKLILVVYDAPRFLRANDQSVREKVPFFAVEEPEWSHTALGTLFAGHWDFPSELRAAISGHHGPDPQIEHARIIAIVHVADVMVHMIGFSTMADETVPKIDVQALELVRLPPERLRIIAETAVEELKKIEKKCGMSLPPA